MSTVKLNKQLLMDYNITGGAGGYSDEDHTLEVISDEIYETGRWSVYHEVIFRWDGVLYSACYSVGATEQQYERPWQDADYIEATPVKPVQKIITVYEPV